VSESHLVSSEQTVSSELIVILGGARSGKSVFAERLAASKGLSVAFIATATAGDDEMRERIIRHRSTRPKGWYTIEESLDLARAVRQAAELADVLLLDCITLWLGNLLLQTSRQDEKDDEGELEFHPRSRLFDERAMQEIENMLTVVKSLGPNKTLIVVTNEAGFGVVPAYFLGRLYRDTLGYVNQRLAQVAERVYFMVAGMAVNIKRLHEEASL
jgi:adenosylcobinamide kinase / adenosylcobinamide-phosphate guanylyltransferase